MLLSCLVLKWTGSTLPGSDVCIARCSVRHKTANLGPENGENQPERLGVVAPYVAFVVRTRYSDPLANEPCPYVQGAFCGRLALYREVAQNTTGIPLHGQCPQKKRESPRHREKAPTEGKAWPTLSSVRKYSYDYHTILAAIPNTAHTYLNPKRQDDKTTLDDTAVERQTVNKAGAANLNNSPRVDFRPAPSEKNKTTTTPTSATTNSVL